MTAFEPEAQGGECVYLYVALDAWPLIADVVHGRWASQDDRGVLVGTAHEFKSDRLPRSVDAERLLDRHWIIYLRTNTDGRRAAERCFFDGIADRYEVEVDPNRNRENVRLLLRLVGARPGWRVLDFGCGPGLSLRASDEVHFVGCDVSAGMREQAAARGLSTVGPEVLPSLQGSFDAVVASYVLHLAVPQADLLAAMQCVRVGGKIAANFHKDRGLADTVAAVSLAESLREIKEERRGHPLHGSIRVWRRMQ